jgi:hypothetical protein
MPPLRRDPTLPADDLPLLTCTPQLLADVTSAMAAADAHPASEDDSQNRHTDVVVGLLDRLDPATAPNLPVLVRAVTRHLQPGVLPAELLTAWLRYAHDAARRLPDLDEHDTITVAGRWARDLALHGSPGEAAHVQGEVIAGQQRAGDAVGVLHARVTLAGMLHTAGRCPLAVEEIEWVWQIWRQDWRTNSDLGADALYQYLVILHGCGRSRTVSSVLTDAAHTSAIAGFGVAHYSDILIQAAAHYHFCTLRASGTADASRGDGRTGSE